MTILPDAPPNADPPLSTCHVEAGGGPTSSSQTADAPTSSELCAVKGDLSSIARRAAKFYVASAVIHFASKALAPRLIPGRWLANVPPKDRIYIPQLVVSSIHGAFVGIGSLRIMFAERVSVPTLIFAVCVLMHVCP